MTKRLAGITSVGQVRPFLQSLEPGITIIARKRAMIEPKDAGYLIHSFLRYPIAS